MSVPLEINRDFPYQVLLAFDGSGMRRKGELSPAAIDRGWPHQIVLPARLCEGGGYREIHEFCKGMTLCNRADRS
jgi:hypothetical protein